MNDTDSVIEWIIAALMGEPLTQPTADAELLFEVASYHGVAALLAERICQSDQSAQLPPMVRQHALTTLQAARGFELARSHDQRRVLSALSSRNIDCILLKGSGLAHLVYRQPYHRERSDTDLFCDLNQIDEIRQVFADLGFVSSDRIYKSHQFTFRSPVLGGDALHYDIHWRISNHPAVARFLSFEEAWQAAIRVEGLGRTLNLTHALALALVHRAANPDHDANRLIWLYDLHLLACKFTDDEWSAFMRFWDSHRIPDHCLIGLLNTQELFGTDLPSAVTARAQATGRKHQLSGSRLSLIFDDLREIKSPSARLAMIREYLFTVPARFTRNA